MSTYNSSSSCSSSTSSLPLDLLHNVLSRLPTISLLKLRSVCRQWCDIIDDPHFTTMHATSGLESPRILLLSEPSRGVEALRFVVDDEFPVTSLPISAVRPWVHAAGASCHGLYCFMDLRDGATYLLNLLTRAIVPLPSFDPLGGLWCPYLIGIGADRLTGRYKIVRVSYLNDDTVVAQRAEVLDQGSQSWRDIASVPPRLLPRNPMFVAGSIHWLAAGQGGVVRISSFDIAKEEFDWTPCPALQNAFLVDVQGVLGLAHRSPKRGDFVGDGGESAVGEGAWCPAEESLLP
ncbi:hypothetical protein ACJRO7_003675 [Eucalyptus globulus]|uniref:F-box domain-containing protein n=1 Tax=Eucalyptus globulus TaxID=34317 RepID=A0ABD3IXG2_EUCGL